MAGRQVYCNSQDFAKQQHDDISSPRDIILLDFSALAIAYISSGTAQVVYFAYITVIMLLRAVLRRRSARSRARRHGKAAACDVGEIVLMRREYAPNSRR